MSEIKQGVNMNMAIPIDTDLDLVDRIVFITVQDVLHRQMWIYPSANATRVPDTNTVNLVWTWEDTFRYDPEKLIYMDTKIFLKNSTENPPTQKTFFRMDSTLFTEEEIRDMEEAND